jgi:hypothetical protein
MSDDTESPSKQELKVLATDLKRIDKNGVRASFTCYFPAIDAHVRDCLWSEKPGGREWVSLPSRSWTNNDGETRHTRIVAFGSFKSDRDFQAAALAAVHELDAKTP